MSNVETEFTKLIGIFKWPLNAIYVALAGAALFGFVKLQRRSKKTTLSKPKLLFLLIFGSCIARIVLDMMPDDWYDTHVDIHPILQMVLDILPELLFFSSYFLLLIMWIEMYYLAKIKDQPKVINYMWILTGVTIGLIFLAGMIFAIAVGASGPYSEEHLESEALFLSTLSLLFTLAFPVGSWFIVRQLRDTGTLTSLKKQDMLHQLQKLLVICVVCSVAHMTYTLILEIYFKGLIENQVLSAIIWLCYFFITEQIPTICIVYLLFRITVAKISSHKTQIKVEGKLLQPLMENVDPIDDIPTSPLDKSLEETSNPLE